MLPREACLRWGEKRWRLMVGVIDYGLGNVASILNMLKKLGTPARLVRSGAELAEPDRLILPGVGAFDTGMERLQQGDWIAPLRARVVDGNTPLLGICLGLQLLTGSSEEGSRPGLGWLPARTVRLRPPSETTWRIPHMGWNSVEPTPGCPLFADFPEPPRFYFVHSYHVECDNPQDVAGRTTHGCAVTAAVARGNLFGTQFHPEKSHRFGMQLLRNFLALA